MRTLQVISDSGIDVAVGLTLTIPQGMSESGGLTINPLTGTGTVILEADCDYTGDTTISAGTLALSGSGGLSGSSAVNVASGALFDLTDSTRNVSVNNLSGGGNIYLSSSASYALQITQTGNNEIDGVISGSGGFELAVGDER